MKWIVVAVFTAAAAFAAVQDLPDGEGKALVSSSCGSCHGLDLITAKQASKEEWQGVVDRMKGYGMAIDAKQTTTIMDYLVKYFGPKGAPAPAANDAGKKTFEGFCGSCHDLDLSSGRTGTKAEWQDIVDRMQGRGAGVPEKEVPGLVDFLATTYAPKK